MNFDGIGYLEGFPDFIDDEAPLCGQTDPDMFFPVDHLDGIISKFEYYSNERQAKEVCSKCPYKLQCLSFALDRSDVQGIWGGTTTRERAAIRRGRGVKLQKSLGLTPVKRPS